MSLVEFAAVKTGFSFSICSAFAYTVFSILMMMMQVLVL